MKTYTVAEIKELCADREQHDLGIGVSVKKQGDYNNFLFKDRIVAWILQNSVTDTVNYVNYLGVGDDVREGSDLVKQIMGETKFPDESSALNKAQARIAELESELKNCKKANTEHQHNLANERGKVSVYERLLGEGGSIV